ncbi:MAG: Hsp70 family protein [Alphaproteobacteria bacterium]|nr:MAG: Hsp70 family protein [Alphaproteobacteria bacterium]
MTLNNLPPVLGLDFGTTNTVAAIPGPGGQPLALPIPHGEAPDGVFRTVLAFWHEEATPRQLEVEAGPFAVDVFLDRREECRFLQSIKTFAASPLFQDTRIEGRTFRFEDLMHAFLRRYRHHTGDHLPVWPERLVVGRPVAFAGIDADDTLAETRYRAALEPFGIPDIRFVYEPVAAAYHFARRLTGPATVLVGDFGGGTSDFSVIRFEPGAGGGQPSADALGHAGVGVAGDAFDQRIVQEAIAPLLGKGGRYRSFGKWLDMPVQYYADLARWNHLALMRSQRTLRELDELARASEDPAPVRRLIGFLAREQGYLLYRAVANAKRALSDAQDTVLAVRLGDDEIALPLSRRDFEAWIAPDLQRIADAVDLCLARAGLAPEQVDRVFLTGGSSYVPAVRRLFEQRFPPGRVETGDQLVSIALGLVGVG